MQNLGVPYRRFRFATREIEVLVEHQDAHGDDGYYPGCLSLVHGSRKVRVAEYTGEDWLVAEIEAALATLGEDS